MAGLTKEGLTILRQNDIVDRLRQNAVPIFQDLVPPNETVNTGNDSTLGRMIALNSIEFTDLWELALAVYQAFDPESSWGAALDNLVQYAGIERRPSTPTRVILDVWGEEGTILEEDILKFRSREGRFYSNKSNVQLDSSFVRGARVVVLDAVQGEICEVSVQDRGSIFKATVVVEEGDTTQTVTAKLFEEIKKIPRLDTKIDGSDIVFEMKDSYMGNISVRVRGAELQLIKARIEATSDEVGRIEQDPNTVRTIATPMLGMVSVNNPYEGEVGMNEETDDELRERFRLSKFTRGSNIVESLYSSLLGIEGLRYARVYENTKDIFDPEYSLPPKSFRVVALGGLDQKVATSIWENHPAGIEAVGNTMVEVRDSQGFFKEIHFDRPDEVPVKIAMEITQEGVSFPENGLDDIKKNLLEYFRDESFIGRDVIYSRLYTPINKIKGFQVDDLLVGRDGNLGRENVPIYFKEVATLGEDDISIVIRGQ